jgi:hypothetical protein
LLGAVRSDWLLLVGIHMMLPYFKRVKPEKLKRPSTTKFPGVPKFMELLREHKPDRIAELLNVAPNTVTKWVKIHELGHLLPAVNGFHSGYHNHMAYRWAKVKISNAEGINGWFRRINI